MPAFGCAPFRDSRLLTREKSGNLSSGNFAGQGCDARRVVTAGFWVDPGGLFGLFLFSWTRSPPPPPTLAFCFVLSLFSFPDAFPAESMWEVVKRRRRCRETSGCWLAASQEIVKIITFACANSVQVHCEDPPLPTNIHYTHAHTHTAACEGQGAAGCLGNPRLPLSCHYSFLPTPPF